MADYIVPPINLTGTFKLKVPLNNLINEKVTYTVDSIKSIPSLLGDMIDVETLVYLEQGLTSEDYNNDLKNDVPIVTLKSEGNALFNIPATYFSYMPQLNGKIFTNKALIINMGYIPDNIDLNFIKDELNDYILSITGITPDISIEEISGKLIVSYEEADTFESERLANITLKETCRYRLQQALDTIDSYKIKIKALVEKFNL